MQVREDDIADVGGRDAELGQHLDRVGHDLAAAPARHLFREPGVDDDRAAVVVHHGPQEVVHRHRGVVRVAAVEVLGPASLAMAVADGMDPHDANGMTAA